MVCPWETQVPGARQKCQPHMRGSQQCLTAMCTPWEALRVAPTPRAAPVSLRPLQLLLTQQAGCLAQCGDGRSPTERVVLCLLGRETRCAVPPAGWHQGHLGDYLTADLGCPRGQLTEHMQYTHMHLHTHAGLHCNTHVDTHIKHIPQICTCDAHTHMHTYMAAYTHTTHTSIHMHNTQHMHTQVHTHMYMRINTHLQCKCV